MNMNIHIYDIDGTLTKVKGDNQKPDSFETYAFWPLLSYHFAENPAQLKAEVEAWDKSDKGIGEAFIKTSHDMLQRGIEHFHQHVNGVNLQAYAKEVTLNFIDEDIIRHSGIMHLKNALNANEVCILSTGSYTEGAIGFVEALMERHLLPADALKKIGVSGATIDWATRTVIHANIGDNKIKGLFNVCRQHGYEFNPEHIAGIYVDDPLGNDSGLCALKPECVYLIRTVKNKDQIFASCRHHDWSEI